VSSVFHDDGRMTEVLGVKVSKEWLRHRKLQRMERNQRLEFAPGVGTRAAAPIGRKAHHDSVA
jgi:hypothetical protein